MKTPKHIICTVTNDLVYDQRMIRICTALVEMGHQVTLVGREKKSSEALVKRDFEQVRLKVSAERGKWFYFQFYRALKRWLLAQKMDVLYAVDLDTLLACAQVVERRPGLHLIYDAHEYFTEVPELAGRPWVKKVWEQIARYGIPKAAACITVSETLGEVLTQKYAKKFHIIRNVPTLKEENLSPKPNPKIILYQGVLNRGRGIEAAILAMHQIEGARLWLVGMGDLEAELKALTQKEGLTHKVVFKGHVRPEQLAEMTRQSWLGINLLEGDSLNYFYSLANKFFDYMMAGVPSLNMNFPEYRRILSEHPMGLLLSELTPDAVAAQVNYLMQNEADYQKMVKAAAVAREVFNWEVEKKKLEGVLG